MKLTETPGLEVEGDVSVLAWTTTPWTLPSNLGVCVGPELDYCVCSAPERDGSYLLAAERVEAVLGEGAEVHQTLKGAELVGWRYEPLFPYFADAAGAFQVFSDDFVSTSDGSTKTLSKRDESIHPFAFTMKHGPDGAGGVQRWAEFSINFSTASRALCAGPHCLFATPPASPDGLTRIKESKDVEKIQGVLKVTEELLDGWSQAVDMAGASVVEGG